MALGFTLITMLAAIFAALIHGATSDACPYARNLDAQFVLMADQVVTPFKSPDPAAGISFLKNVMKFSDADIRSVKQNAIEFFKIEYGIDFSQVQENELGQRSLPEKGAIFSPFRSNPSVNIKLTHNFWTLMRMEKTMCFSDYDAGFGVLFDSEQTLHGKYGGTEGKPIHPRESLVYGYYLIPVGQIRSPLIIQYQSASPIRVNKEDGFMITNSKLYNRQLGSGVAQGVFRVLPTGDGKLHFTIRYVLTFPGYPGLESDQ